MPEQGVMIEEADLSKWDRWDGGRRRDGPCHLDRLYMDKDGNCGAGIYAMKNIAHPIFCLREK